MREKESGRDPGHRRARRHSPGYACSARKRKTDAVALPADGLDVAHSLEEVEMDAGLIERCEDRLRAIDDAFNRLKRGRYGICEKCKQEIPIRAAESHAVRRVLHRLPEEAERADDVPVKGDIDEPSRHVWTPPEELNESVDE